MTVVQGTVVLALEPDALVLALDVPDLGAAAQVVVMTEVALVAPSSEAIAPVIQWIAKTPIGRTAVIVRRLGRPQTSVESPLRQSSATAWSSSV